MKYKLIAFTGKQGAGKTTAAEYFAKAIPQQFPNYKANTIKFAGPIYGITQDICNRTHQEFRKDKLRPLMQFVGTFFRESYGEDFWVNLWELEAKSKLFFSGVMEQGYEEVVLVDDLRYDNEAIKVKALGGYIVQVDSSPEARSERLSIVGAEHPSERGIHPSYVDARIDNDTDFYSFQGQLAYLLRTLK